jgi:ABC-type Fe3+-hydroxamate transport system substrate-binding protein
MIFQMWMMTRTPVDRNFGRIRRLLPMALLCLLWIFFGAGCRRSAPPPADNLPRIISTVPAATQILVQIKAGYTLVGISTYDPPLLKSSLSSLPVVGDYQNLDYELLLVLHPSALIIQMAPSRVPGQLLSFTLEHDIRLVNLELSTLDQIYQTADLLGQISGREPQAKAAVAALQSRLAQIHQRYLHAWHPHVAYLIDTQPVRIVGSTNFMDTLITLAGGENAGAAAGANYPVIDRETLVQLAPDVLLIAAPSEPGVSGSNDPRIAAWSNLPIPAARQHRIYLVSLPDAQIPTLNVDAQVRLLARLIHTNAPLPSPPAQPTLPPKGEL